MPVLSQLRTKLGLKYPRYGPEREVIPQEKIDWGVEYKGYWPKYHVPLLHSPDRPWMDLGELAPDPSYQFNCVDRGINRRSFHGLYLLDNNGCPLNPVGRTGLGARGLLGKWGPNHASDMIVTRILKDQDGNDVVNDGWPVFQFVGIQRRDTGEWAIPGGMIEPGESGLEAAKREFFEEVLSFEDANKEEKSEMEQKFAPFFDGRADLVYKGYVDDPRATDNAWIETQVFHLHAGTKELQDLLASTKFKAGSDARNASWVTASDELELYASHKSFLKKVGEKNGWFW